MAFTQTDRKGLKIAQTPVNTDSLGEMGECGEWGEGEVKKSKC